MSSPPLGKTTRQQAIHRTCLCYYMLQAGSTYENQMKGSLYLNYSSFELLRFSQSLELFSIPRLTAELGVRQDNRFWLQSKSKIII
ncbi:hypothetical protein BGHDH14_bghG000245000002001 [Blumeria hordei DH14]|uniref:Uncharacterized protein n=1 Tax=Blumeria graminis f. sp. hordei (strain DH14) TaxID=546991 RepID=N1J963_BLUG1|nr:hypothetical protein BGHDH14_bghG000245000002001 [Blumeria hordei DH14]